MEKVLNFIPNLPTKTLLRISKIHLHRDFTKTTSEDKMAARVVEHTKTEPSTGVKFPLDIEIYSAFSQNRSYSTKGEPDSNGGEKSVTRVGLGSMGVRTKWMISVYSYGLYFEFGNANLMTSLRSRWRTHSHSMKSVKGEKSHSISISVSINMLIDFALE